jgi:hypothetical protein
MPKNEIDYSNTIIYSISCKDKTISDVYVGHTTNLIKRKCQHKVSYNNLNNKLKIYETIRKNGGWDNWEMKEIAIYNCKNKDEARIKEQKHYEELNSSLNSCPPYVNPLKYYCNICNINCLCSEGLKKHLNTNKHTTIFNVKTINVEKNDNVDKLLTNVSEKSQNSPNYFYCEKCDYNTSKKSDYSKHLLTSKHQNVDNLLTNVAANSPNVAQTKYSCECGKEYKHRQCLYVHKKKCNHEVNTTPNNNDDSDVKVLTGLVLEVVKQNQELTNKIIELSKNGTGNTTMTNSNSNSNNHSNNKTFNLQFFLNETCKDAMNIMDFVESVKLQLSDLENVGEIGYVDGISNIIVKKLNALDESKRPVHCTDTKREVVYIKDDNKWEKEDEDKNKLRKVIKKIAYKNQRLLPEFKKEHPDCGKYHSKFSDQYNKLVVESMGGSGNNDIEKEDKIIRKIAKEVTINKANF